MTAYIVVERSSGRVFVRTSAGLQLTRNRAHALVLPTRREAERLAELRGASRFDIEAVAAEPTGPQARPELGGGKEGGKGLAARTGEALEVQDVVHAVPIGRTPEAL